MEIKNYVMFSYPGAKSLVREVEPTNIQDIVVPDKNVIGISLYREAIEEVTYKGEKINISTGLVDKKDYFIGKFISTEDVKKAYGEKSEVYMKCLQNKLVGIVWRDEENYIQIENEEDKAMYLDPDTLKYAETEHSN